MENDEICNQIQEGKDYSSAVQKIFISFVDGIEKIARLEQVPVCYIIDGLDEQDIWSESSKDSVGRVIVDILEETQNAKYIMSFCQNNLAKFKNTMPAIKFYEKSYVMYFNSIPVKETDIISKFIKTFISPDGHAADVGEDEPEICSTIRKLGRLNVNSGFVYHNYECLKSCGQNDSLDAVYTKYIENQHRICMDELGYNFIHYAPAMAYLFSYEGYTYETFKNIPLNSTNYFEKKIAEYSTQIYSAFVFIKKHKDAREYLIALHYNRSLRYFAENPKEEIPRDAILNKIISRNISLIIKMQWRSDQNKFVIVCHDLIKRQNKDGKNDLGKSTLSMLIYIWTYLDKIPIGTNEDLEQQLLNMDNEEVSWKISDEGSRMKQFVDLNFFHSKELFYAIKSKDSLELVYKILNNEHFLLYNRQYMMWYYGDLTLYGRRNVNNLIPGNDTPYKGLDYYCCFYTLYQKIHDSLVDKGITYYPLLAYDIFTIFDLVFSRSSKIYKRQDIKLNVLNSILNLCRKTQACIREYLSLMLGNPKYAETRMPSAEKSEENVTEGEDDKGEYEQYRKWFDHVITEDKKDNTALCVIEFFKVAEKFIERIADSVENRIKDKTEADPQNN